MYVYNYNYEQFSF